MRGSGAAAPAGPPSPSSEMVTPSSRVPAPCGSSDASTVIKMAMICPTPLIWRGGAAGASKNGGVRGLGHCRCPIGVLAPKVGRKSKACYRLRAGPTEFAPEPPERCRTPKVDAA